MRKVTYQAAVSLDGFLAGAKEEIDWLRQSDDVASIMRESWKGVDAMLMGGKTYEFAARMGGAPAGTSKIRTYVFTTTIADAPEGAELVRADAVGFVRDLKAQPGGDIFLMGGGELAATLVEGGVVDEIGLNVHPILLGAGVPMFAAMGGRIDLSLVEARPIAKECVLLRYRPAR